MEPPGEPRGEGRRTACRREEDTGVGPLFRAEG